MMMELVGIARRLKIPWLAVCISMVVTSCGSVSVNDRSVQESTSSLSNESASSNLALAREEFGRGNYGNAIELLEKELSQRPTSISALNGLGACYDQLGRYDIAQRYYFRALDLAPESSQTLSNLGYSYTRQGRHSDAVAVLELALQKDGGNQVAANNLSIARSRLGIDGENEATLPISSTNNADPAALPDTSVNLAALLGEEEAESIILTSDGAANEEVTVNSTITYNQATPVLRFESPADTDSTASVEIPDPAIIDDSPETASNNQQSDSDTEQDVNPPIEDARDMEMLAELLRSVITFRNSQVGNSESGEQNDDPASADASVTLANTDTSQSSRDSTADAQRVLSPAIDRDSASLVVLNERMAVAGPGSVSVNENVLSPVPRESSRLEPETLLTIDDEPPADPFGSSDEFPNISSLSEPLNLVVKNANGVRGIANATSNWIRSENVNINRITDADNFDYPRTIVEYRPELQIYAEEIAARFNALSISCELVPTNELANGEDVQVFLGHDFARQVSVRDGDLEVAEIPSYDYVFSALKIEVLNGNGIEGIARRTADVLESFGSKIVRIADAASFDFEQSVIYYRTGNRIAVEGLIDLLPIANVQLVESDELHPSVDVSLILGNDDLPYRLLTN